MNELVTRQLERATRRMFRNPLLKLLDPGVGRFVVRALLRRRKTGARKTVPLFFGPEMTIVLPEVISETIYTYGFFDAEVSYIFAAMIGPGDTVLDVGAHFGYFSLLASVLAGERGSVHAFEPTPSTFSLTEHNVRGRTNVHLNNAGAGDRAEELEILDFGLQHSAFNSFSSDLRDPDMMRRVPSRRVRVPVLVLDDYVSARGIEPAFIKVDAENFEDRVVTGLVKTIERFHPAVLLETDSEASLRAGRHLMSIGYRPWVCTGVGKLHPATEDLADENRRHKDLLFLHGTARPAGA